MRKPVEELEEEEDIGTEFDDIPPEDVDGDEDARDDLGVNHNSYEDDPMSHPDVDEVVREVNDGGVEEEKSVIGDQIKLVKKKSIKSKDQANTKNDGRSWLGRLLGFETAEEKKKRLLKERKDRRKKLQEEAALRREKERREDQEREPLLMKEEEERKRKEEEEDDLKSTISWVKNTTGLWDDDPDDSEYVFLLPFDSFSPSLSH